MKRSPARRLAPHAPQLLAALIASVLPLLALAADEEPAKLERVEITGSNIKRLNAEGPQAIQVISAKDMERAGISSASELLDKITNNGDGKVSEIDTNSLVPGANGASLRGLGANATLVLLNGRRVAYYGFTDSSTFVDLSSVPFAAIERVEVLKEGASAIYGTDAIGGVINFILKRSYQGAEVSVGGGQSQTYGDMTHRSVTATLGYGDIAKQGFNLLGVFDHYERDGLLQSARPETYRDQSAAALAAGYQNSDIGYASKAWGVATPAFNTLTSYSNSGNVWNGKAYVANGNCNIGGDKLNAAGTCLHSYSEDISYMPAIKRDSAYGRLSVDITPQTSFFAEAAFSRSKSGMDYIPSSTYQLAYNYFGPGEFGNVQAYPVYLRRLFWEMGPRRRDITSDSSRLIAGLKGEAAGWDWEFALGGARTKTDMIGSGYLNIGAAWDRVGSMNAFGTLSPSDVAAISAESNRYGLSRFSFADAKASRELFAMDGGTAMLALGLDLRREKLSDGSDERTVNFDVVGGAIRNPITGSRNQSAVYGELSLPVTKTLELQLALRGDRYDGFGSTTNPKAAFRWQPLKALMLRGSYSTGFRAPSIPEMFGEYEYWTQDQDGNNIKVRIANAPKLQPEKSRNFNLGAGVELAKDWTVGVDLWSVKRSNQIFFPGPPEAPASVIAKGPEGVPIWIYTPYNIGETKVNGVDLDLTGRIGLGDWGRLDISSVSTYLARVKRGDAQGNAMEVAGEYGNPRLRNVSSVYWTLGDWGAGLYLNHRSQFKAYFQNRAEDLYVPSFSTLDMSVQYSGLVKGLRLSMGLKNLTGRKPPYELNFAGTGVNAWDDPHGRQVWLRASYQFR